MLFKMLIFQIFEGPEKKNLEIITRDFNDNLYWLIFILKLEYPQKF